MRVVIPQIAWHARDPVLTLDFDPKGKTEQGYYRLVTGGADKLLLVWHLTNPDSIDPGLHCVAELTRHQKGINVCRFSPCGTYIAAGDDDSYVFIWKNESISDREEVWNVEKIFRRHVEDVSDLCWSPESNYLVSGSVDNTAVLWDVKKGTPLHFWSEREHTGFVQGVAYDPLGEFSATMCIDRHLRFFNNKTGKVLHKTLKYPPAWLGTLNEDEVKEKENIPDVASEKPVEVDKPQQPPSEPMSIDAELSDDKPLSEINGKVGEEQDGKAPPKKPVTTLNRLFHDDSLKTFCRRLGFSSKGELLIVPGGLLPPVEKKREQSRQSTPVNGEDDENSKDKAPKKFDSEQNNAAIIFCRNSWTNPCAVIPTGTSYSIAARFNTVLYQRDRKQYDYDPEFANSTKKAERIKSSIGKLRPPRDDKAILLDMPYRLVYAVATNDSILIGDTASAEPLACIKNIHCTRMTDISWSPDGLVLVASSTDGYCSIITFEKDELGQEYKIADGEELPPLTPTCFPIAPPEPKPIKKKEPKEPKEVTEKEPKEKKEKEQKEKKEKEPATPVENKEEKKKKTPLVLQMFAAVKNSPSSSLSGVGALPTQRVQQELQKVTLTPSQSPVPQVSSSSLNTAPPVVQTTPKPTFMDTWVKKTPVSASEKKQPRRVNFVTLSSSTPDKSPAPASESQVQPQKASVEPAVESKAVPAHTSVSSPTIGDNATKPPRRVELITLDDSSNDKTQSPPPKKSIAKPRRIQLITLGTDDKGQPPAKRAATENTVNSAGAQNKNGNQSVPATSGPVMGADDKPPPTATIPATK